MEALYCCSAETLFAVLSNPDNTGVFRDIKRVSSRRVLELDPSGRKVIEIEQVGESRILWRRQEFVTLLTVVEDSRDSERLTTSFELVQSDILARFNGKWTLTPLRENGEVTGCSAVLDQDLLPKGIPSFLKHVPVLGDVLRNISVRAVKRLVEDIDGVLEQLRAGRTWDQVFGGAERTRGFAVELSDESEEEAGVDAQEGCAGECSQAHGAHAAPADPAEAAGAAVSPEAAAAGPELHESPAGTNAHAVAAERKDAASRPAHADGS
ncbi:hypothetical protein WJX81_002946 [Elliptochloris bilobata]|uniref:Coenzyme Q-binding protein COQ10 START domain-containing protein n=1 Tax=Elliptochloris bilobata TaxID=381761 RepID=A0AAW1QZD0_9CHLO